MSRIQGGLAVFVRLTCVLAGVLTTGAACAADLTPVELHWLRAGLPVLNHARQLGLPVDVVVQPQDAPGQAPLAMDYVGGRCKLVMSMRGNPLADAALADAPPPLQPIVIEAITAHEVAHCWRHVSGIWKALPAGFVDVRRPADEAVADAWAAMRATRREEGYADLAGLAWSLQRHPGRYAEVHAWFERVRGQQVVPGSHHDTRAWLRAARDPSAFPPGAGAFEQAQALWSRTLAADADPR
jgi:hypothetical protein